MALTITEKQHWKNRIESKLNQRISQLKGSDSDLLKQIRDEAKREVAASRNLGDDFGRLADSELEIKRLENEMDLLVVQVCDKLFDEGDCHYTSLSKARERLTELEEEKAEELLLGHDLGCRITRLKEEKENLLDSILLAVDIRQVIDMWERVTALVTDQAIETDQESLFREAA